VKRARKKRPPALPIEEVPAREPTEHARASREVLYDHVVQRLVGGNDFEQIVRSLRNAHKLSPETAREVAREAEVLFVGERSVERETKRRAAERRTAIAMMRALANANRPDTDFKGVKDAVRARNDSLRTYGRLEELHARFTGAMEPVEVKVNVEVREQTVRVVGGYEDDELRGFIEAGERIIEERTHGSSDGKSHQH
jgi:hypothetical protein